MTIFLVEEHALQAGYGPATIRWRTIVSAKQAINAFIIAEKRFAQRASDETYYTTKTLIDTGQWTFWFEPDELKMVVPDYLWQAADGSSVAYEVRMLSDHPTAVASWPGVDEIQWLRQEK